MPARLFRPIVPLLCAVLAGCSSQPARQPGAISQAVPITLKLKAGDGVTVYGREYPATGLARGVVLLFHQAGSSKDEYATIGPRLAGAGFTALAIDQRSGGNLFGTNDTVAGLGHSADMLAAAPDLQAAVDWGVAQKLPLILWGSSYSASLVFPTAIKNPSNIKAILSFSPREYFNDKSLVARSARAVRVPVYITSAPAADEVAAATAIAAALPKGLATRYVPKIGVHGSSTLIAAKDPAGAETNWQPVLAFLSKVAP